MQIAAALVIPLKRHPLDHISTLEPQVNANVSPSAYWDAIRPTGPSSLVAVRAERNTTPASAVQRATLGRRRDCYFGTIGIMILTKQMEYS
jgi:hypothetical protein